MCLSTGSSACPLRSSPTTISLSGQGTGEQLFGLISYNSDGADITDQGPAGGVSYSGITYDGNEWPWQLTNYNQDTVRVEFLDNAITDAG